MTVVQRLAVPVLVTALSGLLMFSAMGLGGTVATTPGIWWIVALLAPVPVLWFAFRASKGWAAALVAFAAQAIGGCNLLPAYAGTLPLPSLLLGIILPALSLALAALGARFVMQRLTPITAVFAFAFLATGFDYLLALGPDGATLSPAYAQVEMPWMIQSAALFGLWAITFVVALFAAAAAMYGVTRQIVFAAVAAGVLVLNLGYGAWRIADAPQTPLIGVGLAADDDLVPLRFKEDPASALTVVKAYAEAGRALAQAKTKLIVFPERVAVLKPEWRGAVNAELATLAQAGSAVVIAGFDDRRALRRNVALVYFAGGAEPQRYAKRHLVPGLEAIFVPGDASFMTSDGLGVAICKDMDFPTLVREDGLFAPTLYAVPAWDFGQDRIWHARLAILRGVENGFAVARAANNGLLTVSDAYGRVVAVKATAGGGMVTVRADVARGPGTTDYARIGDGLAWIALAMSVLLLGVAAAARKRPQN